MDFIWVIYPLLKYLNSFYLHNNSCNFALFQKIILGPLLEKFLVSKNYTKASPTTISHANNEDKRAKFFAQFQLLKTCSKLLGETDVAVFVFCVCLFIFVNFEFVLIWHWSFHEPFLLRNRWSSFVIPGMVLRPKYCFSWGWIQDELRYFELKQDWSGPLTLHKRTNKLFYSLIFFRALTLMPKLRQALVEFEVSRNARTDYEFCIFVFKGI